jgi:hypothetical protein
MRAITKFLKVFAVILVSFSLVTCSNAPSCTLLGSNAVPVSRASRFFNAATTTTGCPTGTGGGGNNTCSNTLTPTEVLFAQASTGAITTLAIPATSGAALALMCTTATAGLGQITVANLPSGATLFALKSPTTAAPNTVTISEFAIGHTAPVTLTPVGTPITITGAGAFAGFFELQADPSGQFLTLTDSSLSVVHVLLINSTTGALSEAVGSPFPAANALFTAESIVGGAEFVYVSDNSDGQIFIFSFSLTSPKALTPIANSPFVSSGGTANSPISMLVNSNQSILYTANNLSISILAIQSDGSLLPAPGSNTPVTPTPAFSPFLLAFDNTGSFLYVMSQGTEGVLGYTINTTTGGLTLIGGSPFATGTTSNISDMIADPVLTNLYLVINGVINPFTIGTGGVLTAPAVTPTFTASTNLAIANVQ